MPCRCAEPPLQAALFEIETLGVDPTNGRYADVTLETCRECGQRWLCYALEYEAFSHSGRHFRGPLTATAPPPAPEAALAWLESQPWYLAGGSYFQSPGHRRQGRAPVD